jgi:Ser/Thr protein kinase RdoA (MazF antagonist)
MANPNPELAAIAGAFALPGPVTAISPLGHGNVNDTYRVDTASGERFVLQRLNTQVFPQPKLVMGNLQLLSDHAERGRNGLGAIAGVERWEVPRVIANRHSGDPWVTADDQFWRLISFVDDAVTVDAIANPEQARQVGRGLGLFHSLISDLPTEQLADTLPGFHITPAYLDAYDQTLKRAEIQLCEAGQWCAQFVEQRRQLAPVLEAAKADGRLRLRPIHGDPKVNNVMLCASSGVAVSLVDLDTVKPGLVHYDIGDCLRSACNPLGEEAGPKEAIHFDLDLCRAVLEGYLGAARDSLSDTDLDHIFDAARVISFELGLRFFNDHLAGDVYFRTQHPGHNLDRALVQFKLTASIEAQEQEIRAIVEGLR